MWPVLHPLVIHFPIALLLVNFGLTLAYLRRRDPFLERSAYGALVIGWWGAFAAVLTGTLDVARVWPLPDEAVGWLNAHLVLGLLLLFVSGRALLMRRRDPYILEGSRCRSYLTLICLNAFLVVVGGWIGGRLVYSYGLGVNI